MAIVNKVDIASYVEADPDKMIADALENIPMAFKTSIRTGEGIDRWLEVVRSTIKE